MKKSRMQIIIYRKNKYKNRRQDIRNIKHAKKGEKSIKIPKKNSLKYNKKHKNSCKKKERKEKKRKEKKRKGKKSNK